MTDGRESGKAKRNAKFHRARVRNFVFTHGPNRISRGRLAERHLADGLVLREIEIASPRWPRAFDGLRIGHFSDAHVGQLIPVARAVDGVRLLAEREPDLLVCTGDVVDLHAQGIEPLFGAMAETNAPMGCAMVLGNHDELDDARRVVHLAEQAGVPVLEEEALEIRRGDDRLVVAGIGWARTAAACASRVRATCGDETHLLLAHNPKAFVAAAELGVPLTLSGHTHGGQVALPGFPKMNLAMSHRHSAGLFERAASRLFVTVGVGSWFPLRWNCPAEVVMITMRSGTGA